MPARMLAGALPLSLSSGLDRGMKLTLASPESADRSDKPRISRKLRRVLDLLVSGECRTIKAAAMQAGLNADYVRRAIKSPPVMRLVDARIRANLAAATLRGSERLAELVDSSSQKTSLEATLAALRVGGYYAPDNPSVAMSVNVGNAPGYVINLERATEHVEEALTIEGEAVEVAP